jgi:hypothetical protein
MGEPTFNGLITATNRNSEPTQSSHGDHVTELKGDAVLRHESGAYIRFSQEGDIFIVPAPNRIATLGHDNTTA